MEEIFALVTNFGFPIVLTFYLLIRMEQKMVGLTSAIQELRVALEKICD